MTQDLEALLRQDAAAPRNDDGFTRRVMASLPPSGRAPAWVRPTLVMGSSIAGSAIALAFAPRDSSLALSLAEYFTSGVVSQTMLTSIAIGAVLLVSALVLAVDSE